MRVPILLPVIVCAIFSACHEFPPPPVKLEKMWDCHHEQSWDSLSTAIALHGTWKWEFVSCYWTPDEANDDEFADLMIEFNPDGTLRVYEDNQVTLRSDWSIRRPALFSPNTDFFAVEAEPWVSQLFGRILLCDDWVLFNGSPVDGCDHYFVR